eukprot:TRINITY_DN37550_c0_g1_i1.p1 TRINITY_DN37550_c0_g1~~TRINITY_DN37550_c0_g1_i1.p1  ORF type:complete len:107 (-),score=3.67 TRINITY_DN37550_c0_g1_i1:108-428(-)
MNQGVRCMRLTPFFIGLSQVTCGAPTVGVHGQMRKEYYPPFIFPSAFNWDDSAKSGNQTWSFPSPVRSQVRVFYLDLPTLDQLPSLRKLDKDLTYGPPATPFQMHV